MLLNERNSFYGETANRKILQNATEWCQLLNDTDEKPLDSSLFKSALIADS